MSPSAVLERLGRRVGTPGHLPQQVPFIILAWLSCF